MAEEVTNAGTESTTSSDVIEIDLEEAVGNAVTKILDERGLTKDNMAKLGILDDLTSSIEGMFKSNKPAKTKEFDSEGFTQSISKLIDTKLAGINTGGSKPKQTGPLARFLGFGDTASD